MTRLIIPVIVSVRSVRQDLERLADPDVQASLVHVSADRGAAGDSWATHAGGAGTPTSTGRFYRGGRATSWLGSCAIRHDSSPPCPPSGRGPPQERLCRALLMPEYGVMSA